MLSMLSSLDPIARIVVATLFNSLWEAALLALAVWVILKIVPNASATTRYAAWSFALVASLLLPIATAIPQVRVQHANRAPHSATRISEPAARTQTAGKASAPATQGRAGSLTVQPSRAPAVRLPQRFNFSLPQWVALGLFGAWALAAIALLVRLGVNLYRLERLKTDALPLPIDYRSRLQKWSEADKGGREVRLCVCDQIEVPVAVGLFDSMILIPQHLLDTLSQDEIDQIMLHELAHLRRADDWTNGLQRVIQALFFFNPAILFIAQQLDLEREVACDDWVVRQTASVRPYASCLTRMAEVTAWPHRAMAAPGVFVTRRGLSVRVERLLRAGRDIRTSISFGPAGAVVAVFVVMFFVLESVAPTFAFTQEDVTIPAQHITIPGQTIRIPSRTISTKTQRVQTPAQVIRVAPGTLDIPAQHVRVASKNAQLPPAEITVPGQHYQAAHYAPQHNNSKLASVASNSAGANESATRAQQLGTSAAQLGLEAASEGMREAANAMNSVNYHAHYHSSNTNYSGFNCVGCDYSNQNLAGKNFSGQRFNGTDFSHADLHGANFTNAELTGVDFSDANLRDVSFRGAKLNGCDLSNAQIDGASFDGADVTGCDVNAKALAPEQARQWLRTCRNGCDFSGANLRGQDLSGVDLTGVDLSDADLTNANLSGAKLSGVDFSGAHLQGANLTNTQFVGCDLSDVNMSGVDMSRAQFVGDKFDGTQH